MKKVLSILLAVSLVFGMTFVMSACGDNSAETEQNEFLPEALRAVTAEMISDLEGTAWQLAGGMIDGVEMEQEDLDALLEAAGGAIQYIFTDDANIQMATPLNTLDGTYTLESENTIVHMVFPQIEYYGIFSIIGEQTVFMIADPNQAGSALYLTQVEEG